MEQYISYSIGLDVDKETVKACFKSREGVDRSVVKGTRTFSNKQQGFKELQGWIEKHRKSHQASLKVVMEATGVYHEHLAWSLQSAGYLVHIILPTRAKRYMQSLGQKSKNDKIDAQGLADMGLQQELAAWVPFSKNILSLRSLTRQVEMFQETRTSLSNQLEAAEHMVFSDELITKNLKEMIDKLEKTVNELKEAIAKCVEQDPLLSSKYELVKTIKGLGLLTFATLVAETGGFKLFENQKQLVSYTGYDIVENQSGGRVGKTRISKQGNAHIRRILFMASLNMVRYQVHPFYQLYHRVYERTKIKMKGYVAVQRKLLCLIYALWKRDEIFDPKYNLMQSDGHESKIAAI